MLAAMRLASSRVSSLAAARRPGSIPEIGEGERLPVGVPHDEALLRRKPLAHRFLGGLNVQRHQAEGVSGDGYQ